MATLIGATLASIKQAGERRFAQRLISHLEDDYLIWYDVPVGKHRRYPDFIILHPLRGLLFIEVKDWKIDTLKRMSVTTCTIETSTGHKEVPHPLEQARQYAYPVVNDLLRNPQLKQALEGKHAGRLVCPYGWGAVFTNITRTQIEKGVPEELRERLFPEHQIMFKDEMVESIDTETLQEKLWGMFNVVFPCQLTLPQIDAIRWHLFPDLRIVESGQTTLFDEEEKTELQDTLPEIVRIMDIQQEQLARSLGDGHRVIHGVAGSGKTLILGYRCIQLAEALNKPILVLCFNITLATKLRQFISLRGIHNKVQVFHFHDWCGQQLKTYHVDILLGPRPVYDRMVDSVIEGVDKGLIPRAQYGALLIDEGHDFEPEWLKLVTQMIDPETSSLLLLYDDAQSIYKKRSSLKFSLSSVGIQAQGRTTILKLNYRNTREILEFAYFVVKDYLKDKGKEDIPLVKLEAAGVNGNRPVVKSFDTLNAEADYLIRCILKWKDQGTPLSEIAILYPGGIAGKVIANALDSANIPNTLLSSRHGKKSYDTEAEKVSILTIHSSKGLEFKTVIIFDASYYPDYKENNEEGKENLFRLLYVGMTRARENLLMTFNKHNVISQALTSAISA